MSTGALKTLPPSAPHTHTVIFLHGRGSTAEGFMSEFFESQASDDRRLPEIFPQIRWGFPTSGILPSRSFGPISQWYDMASVEDPSKDENEHREVIDSTLVKIIDLINQEAADLRDPRKVILAGISQGCTIAVQALRKQELQLGGLLGLSSWLPAALASMNAAEGAQRTPIFLSHSKDDNVIALKYGEQLRDSFKENGMVVEWHEYEDGGHWINEPEGIDDMVAFLKGVMANGL